VIDLETGRDRVVAETCGCEPQMGANINRGLTDYDGFTLTDTSTGKCHMIATISSIFERADPSIVIDDPNLVEIYGFHSKFNSQSDCVMLSMRWFPATEESRWDMFWHDVGSVRFAWVTMRLDGSEMHCAVGPEQWEKGGHHATWFPDGWRISMNLNIDRDCLRFVQVNAGGSALRKIREDLVGSGHPTVFRDANYLLTDAYPDEHVASGDGTVPLRWIDLSRGNEKTIVRINARTAVEDSVLRVDPHPAWDRSGRYVALNGFIDGTRRVFVADMYGVVAPQSLC